MHENRHKELQMEKCGSTKYKRAVIKRREVMKDASWFIVLKHKHKGPCSATHIIIILRLNVSRHDTTREVSDIDLKMWKSKCCSYKYLKFHFKILFFNVKANETIDKKLHRVQNLTSHTNYQASRRKRQKKIEKPKKRRSSQGFFFNHRRVLPNYINKIQKNSRPIFGMTNNVY